MFKSGAWKYLRVRDRTTSKGFNFVRTDMIILGKGGGEEGKRSRGWEEGKRREGWGEGKRSRGWGEGKRREVWEEGKRREVWEEGRGDSGKIEERREGWEEGRREEGKGWEEGRGGEKTMKAADVHEWRPPQLRLH